MPLNAGSTRKLARRILAAAALAQLLVLACSAFPLQTKNSAAPKAQKTQKKEDGRHQIDRLEDKWRDAVMKNDAVMLDGLLSEDYIAILANGTLQTKDQQLASVRAKEWHITALEMSERKVRFYGRTALVTSLAQVEGSTSDGDITGTYRYTRVYARDTRGLWKIVNFEASRIGHPHHSSGQRQNAPQSLP